MKKHSTPVINYDKLTQRVNDSPNEREKNIRTQIVQNLGYISAQEFQNSLQKMTKWFNEYIQDRPDYMVVFDSRVGKSRRWVYNSISHAISKKPLIQSYENIGFYQYDKGKYWNKFLEYMIKSKTKNPLFVLFDDCSYSWTQYLKIIFNMIREFNDWIEKWDVIVDAITIVVCAPYFTHRAIQTIADCLNDTENIIINDDIKKCIDIVIYPQHEILPLHCETLNSDDVQYLRNKSSLKIYGEFNKTVSFFQHRVSDLFAFYEPLIPLIEQVQAPYRYEDYIIEEKKYHDYVYGGLYR